MNAVQTAPVRVETHGRVPEGMGELEAAKAGSLLRLATEPVLSARVMLAVCADPKVCSSWAGHARAGAVTLAQSVPVPEAGLAI
jgi:hypothetical protein